MRWPVAGLLSKIHDRAVASLAEWPGPNNRAERQLLNFLGVGGVGGIGGINSRIGIGDCSGIDSYHARVCATTAAATVNPDAGRAIPVSSPDALVLELLKLPDLDARLDELERVLGAPPGRLAVARRYANEDALLADGHGPQPVHYGDGHKRVFLERAACDVQHARECELRIGRVPQRLYGLALEVVASRAWRG